MNRRELFKNLALTAGGIYVSTKTIFLPPSGGWPYMGIDEFVMAPERYRPVIKHLNERRVTPTVSIYRDTWLEEFARDS